MGNKMKSSRNKEKMCIRKAPATRVHRCINATDCSYGNKEGPVTIETERITNTSESKLRGFYGVVRKRIHNLLTFKAASLSIKAIDFCEKLGVWRLSCFQEIRGKSC